VLGLHAGVPDERAHKSETLVGSKSSPSRQALAAARSVLLRGSGREDRASSRSVLELECRVRRVKRARGLRNRCLRQHRPSAASSRAAGSTAPTRHQSRDRRVADERHAPCDRLVQGERSEYTVGYGRQLGGPSTCSARRIGPCHDRAERLGDRRLASAAAGRNRPPKAPVVVSEKDWPLDVTVDEPAPVGRRRPWAAQRRSPAACCGLSRRQCPAGPAKLPPRVLQHKIGKPYLVAQSYTCRTCVVQRGGQSRLGLELAEKTWHSPANPGEEA